MKQTRGKKRLLAMLLALVMCLGLLPVSALAAQLEVSPVFSGETITNYKHGAAGDEIPVEAPGSSVAEEVPAKPLDANAERAVSDGAVTVSAPDKDLSLQVWLEDGVPYYTVTLKGAQLIEKSKLGLVTQGAGSFDSGLTMGAVTQRTVDNGAWKPVVGERESVADKYGEALIPFSNANGSFTLEVRAYNTGVALRYDLPEVPADLDTYTIADGGEKTQFAFPEGATAFLHTSGNQTQPTKKPVESLQECFHPMTVTYPNGAAVTICEGYRDNYSALKLTPDGTRTVKAKLAGAVTVRAEQTWLSEKHLYAPAGPMSTPWRAIVVGETLADLAMNNTLSESLNPAPDEETYKFSEWVEAGVAHRGSPLNNETLMSLVDAAAAHGYPYIELDSGWYGPEYDSNCDPRLDPDKLDPSIASDKILLDNYYAREEDETFLPNGEGCFNTRGVGFNQYGSLGTSGSMQVNVDIPALCDYAAKKGVGVILYVNVRFLPDASGRWRFTPDELFAYFERWGVAGIKPGFVNCRTQDNELYMQEVVRAAAKHHLVMTVHDEWIPAGLSRTFPNLLTAEAISGDEEHARNTVPGNINTIFTRTIQAPADHTFCWPGEETKGYALASPIMFRSGLSFLFWYTRVDQVPEKDRGVIDFFDDLPATWKNTLYLEAQMDGYATIARQSFPDEEKGLPSRWYVGSLSAIDRTMELPLTFLEPNTQYVAEFYTDGADANPDAGFNTAAKNAQTLEKAYYWVDSTTTLTQELGTGYGCAVRLTKQSDYTGDTSQIRPYNADLAPLKALLDKVGALSAPDPVTGIWTRLQTTKDAAQAVHDSPDSTTADIAQATASLKDALALQEAAEDLVESITSIEVLLPEYYTENSWAKYQAALTLAQDKLDTARTPRELADAGAVVRSMADSLVMDPSITLETVAYITDLTYESKSKAPNFHVGKNRANGALTVRINGVDTVFPQGFGMDTPGDLYYNLEGKDYQYFSVTVGLDTVKVKEGNGDGIIFRIYGDGKKLWDSGVVDKNNPSQSVIVPVEGIKELRLESNVNGDKNHDWADWCDAKFLATRPAMDVTYLSDLDYDTAKSTSVNFGNFKKKMNRTGGPLKIRVNGVDTVFDQGVGMDAPTDLYYNIEGKGFQYFSTVVGLDVEKFNQENGDGIIFKIYGDGELLWESGLIGPFNGNTLLSAAAKVDIQGVKELRLESNKNGNQSGDWANWCDAKFLAPKEFEEPVPTIDLALGQTVTASSAADQAGSVTDGSVATRWTAAGGSFPQSVTVDLGASRDILQFIPTFYDRGGRVAWFKIYTSEDGEDFTLCVDKTNNNVSGRVTVDAPENTKARYVKVEITGMTIGNASLAELSVIGPAGEGAQHTATIVGGTGSGSYLPGETVLISAQPQEGAEFGGWAVTAGKTVLADPTACITTFTMPNGDVTVTAQAKPTAVKVFKDGVEVDETTELKVYTNNNHEGHAHNHSLTLTAQVLPANAANKNVKWLRSEVTGKVTLSRNGNQLTITAVHDPAETNVGEVELNVYAEGDENIKQPIKVKVVRMLENPVTISIQGVNDPSAAPQYGQTLEADINQLKMTDAGKTALTYQWKRAKDNTTENIANATAKTYTLTTDDVGATISVDVTADPATYYEGTRSATRSQAVVKADRPAITANIHGEKATAEDNSDGKIVGFPTDDNLVYEYKLASAADATENWHTVSGAEVTVAAGDYVVRIQATATHNASATRNVKVGTYNSTMNQVKLAAMTNGSVTRDKPQADPEDTVTLTIVPATGYELDAITVTKDSGSQVTLSGTGNTRAFTMPDEAVTVNATFKKIKLTITHELTHLTCSKNSESHSHEVEYGDTAAITLVPDEGYTLPARDTIEIKNAQGVAITGWTINDQGTITFSGGVTSNLTIKATGIVKTYVVNYAVSNGLSAPEANAARSVAHKAAYTGTLVAAENYKLPESITVTMNGENFTDFTYENGVLTIAEGKIVGNLVVTASGVLHVPVSGVTLDKTSVSLTVGGTTTLTATVLPANAANQNITWTSSDEDVATVDTTGKVTAVAAGTATITVTTEDGGKTATCEVTVTKPAEPSRPSTGGSRPATSTEVTTNPDGSKTTTVTDNRTGTVTATTEKPDGTKEVVETKKDGTVTETVTAPDGAKTEKVTDPEENVTITVTDSEGEELAKVEIPATIPETETRFEDVPENHWADEAIHNAAALKLVEGIGNNKYDMVSPMTRGALATVLHRLSNKPTGTKVSFSDVSGNAYYTEGVAWAAKVGVVTGFTADIFAPDQVITREQLAVMLARYAKLIGLDTKADAHRLSVFTDGEKTGDWAVDGVAWCVQSGILQGKGQNNLDPTANVTRAEVAVMLDRFIALIK